MTMRLAMLAALILAIPACGGEVTTIQSAPDAAKTLTLVQPDIGCRVTSSWTIPQMFVETAILFDGTTYDTDAMHNGSRVEITTAGKYSFSCNLSVSAINGGATVFLRARRNGLEELEVTELPQVAGLALSMPLVGENVFGTGDYIEFTYMMLGASGGAIRANAVVRKV